MKITNDLKSLAIFIGAVIGIIAGVLELIVAIIIGAASLNGGIVRVTGNLSIFPDAFGFIVAIFLLQIILSAISISYGEKLKVGNSDRKHRFFKEFVELIYKLLIGLLSNCWRTALNP